MKEYRAGYIRVTNASLDEYGYGCGYPMFTPDQGVLVLRTVVQGLNWTRT